MLALHSGTGEDSGLMSATVLIVDDDEPTQKLIEALMRRNGLLTLVAQNGAAAIEILAQRDDLRCVILDIMMPEVGGPAVIEYMKTNRHKVPVVVCTAAMQRTMPVFDADIVRATFQKPFDIDQLTSTVLELVG
jgi:DNA-binding NtrC family response regulator